MKPCCVDFCTQPATWSPWWRENYCVAHLAERDLAARYDRPARPRHDGEIEFPGLGSFEALRQSWVTT